jgi:hypothetical protein
MEPTVVPIHSMLTKIYAFRSILILSSHGCLDLPDGILLGIYILQIDVLMTRLLPWSSYSQSYRENRNKRDTRQSVKAYYFS